MPGSPHHGPGAAIRTRRTDLGLSLDDVAAATRIPVAHLRAIEEGEYDKLPSGPYAAGYVRTLCDYLRVEDLDLPSVPVPTYPPPRATTPRTSDASDPGAVWVQGPSLAWVQRLALVSAMGLFALVISVLLQVTNPLDPTLPLPEGEDQVLEIKAQARTHVRMVADGEVVLDKVLAPKEAHTVTWREAVSVDVQAVADVRLAWNGTRIRPQGQQRTPRRLVFVEDRIALGGPRGVAEGR